MATLRLIISFFVFVGMGVAQSTMAQDSMQQIHNYSCPTGIIQPPDTVITPSACYWYSSDFLVVSWFADDLYKVAGAEKIGDEWMLTVGNVSPTPFGVKFSDAADKPGVMLATSDGIMTYFNFWSPVDGGWLTTGGMLDSSGAYVGDEMPTSPDSQNFLCPTTKYADETLDIASCYWLDSSNFVVNWNSPSGYFAGVAHIGVAAKPAYVYLASSSSDAVVTVIPDATDLYTFSVGVYWNLIYWTQDEGFYKAAGYVITDRKGTVELQSGNMPEALP